MSALGLFRKAPKAVARQPKAPRRQVALVVDDDMTIAELNEAVFAGRAWDVRTAYSGLGALSDGGPAVGARRNVLAQGLPARGARV